MQSEALILRSTALKENDRLVTALSEKIGVIRAFANGARKPNSPLHGASQLYAHGQLELARRRDTYILTEAQARGVFFDGLAADITRLALANYLAALCVELAPQEEPAPEQLRLMLNALHFLSAGLRPQLLVKTVVELRLVSLAGWMPDTDNEAVRFICDSPLERAFRFTLPEEGLRELSRYSQEYIAAQTNRRFEELAYYEKINL